MQNKKMEEIKKVVLYFFTEFFEETRDKSIALELTKEAMTTYRTEMINEEKSKEKITPAQLNYLNAMMGDFSTSAKIKDELAKLGKSLDELTKTEASWIISKVKREK